ncbi:MAG: sugar-binding domain-containing protein, partial [Christensenellales bacterium]
MIKIPFNFDWNRIDGRPRWFADNEPTTHVDLPDDFCLNKHRSADAVGGAATGFIPGGEATYRKEFRALADWQGKTVLLGIDGAYMNAEVTLNNDLLFHHPYGYTAFMVDLTKHLRAGDIPNMLSISTESYQPNTRWYSGGGLFREVALYVGGRARIAPWELFVTTPDVSAEKATVNVAIN